MGERIYPRMSYHEKWPAIAGQVIQNVAHDMSLGDGWDDPYGVRSPVAAEEVAPVEPAKRKGGRPRKVVE